MASQTKLTSYFRPTKSNSSSAAAAKRRKAVIDDSETLVAPVSESSVETLHQPVKSETGVVKTEPAANLLDALAKVEQLKTTEPASNIFTSGLEVGKSVQKKTTTRKPRKASTKASSKEAQKEAVNTIISIVEKIKEETTSVQDNHGCIPAEISTPKVADEPSASVRKRKMQCIEQQSEETVHTPPKVEVKKETEVKTCTKVRKRLEMGGEKNPPPAVNSVEEVKLQSTIPVSPMKQVQFLRMGNLSPRKPESPLKISSKLASPKQALLRSAEKRMQSLTDKNVKSPAVKSLASLLDKVPPAPTKLTPEEIKARLGSNKNLAELRAKLSKVNNCSAQVKDFYNTQVQLKKVSSVEFDLEIPVSPRKQQSQSPVKRDKQVQKRPAFERFHALAEPPSSHLNLPFKYKVLNEVFRCLETVVTMLYNRKECIFFNKVKPAVQKMLQRDFTEKHLAQICHVFPSAYKISYEQLAVNLQNSPVKTRGFQLIIAPRLNYLSPQLLDEEESNEDAQDDHKSFQPIGPTMLVERRYIFHNRLIKIVKQHHTSFLAEYNPMLNVPEDKVTRWHQNFDVDGVPDVPATSLPSPPELKTFATAKDVLEQAHNLGTINPRLEAALRERAVLKDDSEPSKKEPEVKKPEPAVNVGLKGVSQSLIDKIRAREAAKSQKQMTMNTEEIRRQSMSKMLPELARIINSVYVTEKKAVLPLTQLVEKIQYSHRGIMSASSIEEHIRLIRTVYPEWLDVLRRGTIDYIKVDRKIDSNVVYQKLEDNAKS